MARTKQNQQTNYYNIPEKNISTLNDTTNNSSSFIYKVFSNSPIQSKTIIEKVTSSLTNDEIPIELNKNLSSNNEETTQEIPTIPCPFFNFILIVINPFLNSKTGKIYQKGQMISDCCAIESVIQDGNLSNCVKVKR